MHPGERLQGAVAGLVYEQDLFLSLNQLRIMLGDERAMDCRKSLAEWDLYVAAFLVEGDLLTALRA